MLTDTEFSLLLGQEKEALVSLVIQLVSRVEALEKPLSLPELPPAGQYVIRDSSGAVRLMGDENKFLIRQVEAIAILLSLSDRYVTIQFYLNNQSRLMSEWSRGKMVVRC